MIPTSTLSRFGKIVSERFWDSGMTPDQVAERMDVPIKIINACLCK